MYAGLKTLWVTLALVVFGSMVLLSAWRWFDRNADTTERLRLISLQPGKPARFDPAMVKELPDAAHRYFLFSIAPGTQLKTVAEIAMTGRFSLGSKHTPNYFDMTAQQTRPPAASHKKTAENADTGFDHSALICRPNQKVSET